MATFAPVLVKISSVVEMPSLVAKISHVVAIFPCVVAKMSSVLGMLLRVMI